MILENEAKEKEAKRLKALQKKNNIRNNTGSPFVRVQDVDSNANSVIKDKSDSNIEEGQSKPSTGRPKKNIKKWDSHGKNGGVKMDYTR